MRCDRRGDRRAPRLERAGGRFDRRRRPEGRLLSGFSWIDRPERLAAAAERWGSSGFLAFDTEFVFERTFRPRLGLVQIASAGEIALVDPLAVGDLEPLARLLADPAVHTAGHALGGDLVALRPWLAAPPAALFDTQIAAAFAGLGVSLSYAALVSALEGVELGKHETRTDWLRRPLSPEQVRYAAEDVEHLPALVHELRRRLDELGRLAWAEEESSAAAGAALESPDPTEAWRRLRGVERLPARAHGVARALAAWREREAERLDLARPFLMRDPTLIALARRGELDPAAAAKLPGYDRHRHERHLTAWRRALAAAAAEVAEDPGAGAPEATPRSEAERGIDAALAELATQRAAALGLPPELLLSRRDRARLARAIASGIPPTEALAGWRREALAPLPPGFGGTG